jgi:hypothetical protein
MLRPCQGDARVSRAAKRRRSVRRPPCGATIAPLEQLEARIALSVSGFEQEFIYLLNRARHDPVAYQVERGLSVSLGSITRRPPLAVNASLTAAAEFKSGDMATRDYFKHDLLNGETPNQVVRRFGYDLPQTVSVDGRTWSLPAVGNMIQTISAGRSTPAATLQSLIESPGNRDHLLGVTAHNQAARHVGIGYEFRDRSTYKHYWTVLVTPAKSSTPFLTGVAFADRNGNRRFEAAEGLGSVVITASGAGGRFTTTTMAAGGWTLAVPPGDYVVTASGGSFAGTSSASVRVGTHNVAVDFVSGTPRAWVNFVQAPATAPTAPTGLVATAGNGRVSLRWTAPASNGGAAITNYVIQRSSDNGKSWTTVNRAASTATTATVTGLVSGRNYIFRVAAVNSAGTGRLSSNSNSAKPLAVTVPRAPTGLVATAGNGRVSLRWTAPASNGGAAITNYVIQHSSDNGKSWTTVNRAASTATTATVTGLVNGRSYIFRVAAVNRIGRGGFSTNSSSVRPVAATVPGAPVNVVVTIGNAQASLRWAAPTSNGGAAITNYVVQYSSNNGSSWTTVNRAASAATTATVTRLVNGTPYIFRVAAVNAAGTGSFTITVPDYPITRTNPGLNLEKMLDMANTKAAENLEKFLRNVAQGNERSAKVTKITVDRATGDVSGSFEVRHRQVSGSVYNPITRKRVPVVTYDARQSGSFTFNIFSMDIRGTLDLGRGVKVSLADLKKFSEGDFTPLWTSALTLRQESNYNGRVADIRARHGAANVYVAPKSFVDWMGPSTLVRWGSEAVLSGGASLSTIPAEVANKIRAETLGIRNWVTARVKNAATAEAIAKKIVGALANRGNIEDPRFSIRWSKVDYWYESNLVAGIKTQRIEHGMYSIVLKI